MGLDPAAPLPTTPHTRVARWFSVDAVGPRVLGLIVGTAVMAAAGELSSVGGVAATVISAALIYWIAEAYADAVATNMSSEHAFLGSLGHELRQRWPMVEAAFEPLVAMALALALGASASLAITIGLSAGTGLLFVYAWVAATSSGLKGWHRAGAAFTIAGLGALMVLLKIYIHSPRKH